MGYDLHITRKAQWIDEDGPSISPQEWLALLEADPELSRATDARDDELTGAWKGQTIFWFTDGEVRCSNPDQPMIRKMVAIAEQLGATVQGDDGEIYREDGTPYQQDAGSASIPPAPSQPGLLARIASWFRHRRNVRDLQAAPSFRAGQRVRNMYGEPAPS